MPSKIVADGHCYPRDIVDNAEFIRRAQVELPDLQTLAIDTKMKTRTWCGPEESTSTMARSAVGAALETHLALASASTLPRAHVPEPETPGMEHLGRKIGDTKGAAGSSSIPACLSHQLVAGKVKRGDLVLAVAVGAGLDCAGSLFYA